MIVALDPGRTTGWATYDLGEHMHAGQWVEPLSVYSELSDMRPTLIVCESFLFRQKIKIDFTPVEVIGVVKLFCYQSGIELVMQTPSQAKHFFTDDRLKERGLYQAGQPHANDATRHMLYYLEFGKGKQHG